MTDHQNSTADSENDGMRRIILALFNPMPDGHEKGCLANDPHIKPRGPCICKYGEAAGEYLWALREAKKIASEHYGRKEVEESRRLEEPIGLVEAAALVPVPAQPAAEPVAYAYERATARTSSGKPALWQNELTFGKPDTHEFIRNVRPLYAAQPPADPVDPVLATLKRAPELLDAAEKRLDQHFQSSAGSEPVAFINTRLADLAEANALYGKDQRLGAPDKIARNEREISWLKELRSIIKTEPQEVKAWCQPMDNGKHSPRKFLLYFEDADRGIAVFDNEDEARTAFEKANTAWNCYLFGSLPLSRPHGN